MLSSICRLYLLFVLIAPFASFAQSQKPPVLIGLDAEFSWPGSTSAQAIQQGILLAVEEINTQGGVLDGRPLQLISKDNRTVPARSIQNLKDFAAMEDLVAVFCGRFSPTVIESLEVIHALKIPLLDPWAAADIITEHNYEPSYTFRLSLRDDWAMPTLLKYAQQKGIQKVGLMALNTAWGRSNLKATEEYVETHNALSLVGTVWFNWQDETLITKYQRLQKSGAQAILLVANDREASILLREMMQLPKSQRLPILSHWGASGGEMASLANTALQEIDFTMVQTYSFIGQNDSKAKKVISALKNQYDLPSERAIESPVGVAHAYDLTHILAMAIELAGTTQREAIREALENVRDYRGLIKDYPRPFTPQNHDALSQTDIILARYAEDGTIVPIHKP